MKPVLNTGRIDSHRITPIVGTLKPEIASGFSFIILKNNSTYGKIAFDERSGDLRMKLKSGKKLISKIAIMSVLIVIVVGLLGCTEKPIQSVYVDQ